MKKALLNIFLIAICVSVGAQTNELTIKGKESLEAIKSATNYNNWTIKDINIIRVRNESPRITSHPGPLDKDYPDDRGYMIDIFDLSNNNLDGQIPDLVFRNKKYFRGGFYFKGGYRYKVLFSHNKLKSVTGWTGIGWNFYYAQELRLDNNELEHYQIQSVDEQGSNTSMYSGFYVFTIHQNNLKDLNWENFFCSNPGNQGNYLKHGAVANRASLARIDNNRLDFNSLISIVEKVRFATQNHNHVNPGNPDFVFDYYPQKPLGGDATEETLAKGTGKTLSFKLKHEANIYTWQLNGVDVPLSTMNNYTFDVNEGTAGVWRCKITNPNLPDVTLYSYDMAVFMEKSNNKAISDFNFSHGSITELFPENAIIGDFSGSDPDGDEVFYRLPDNTADNSHFRIINGKTLVSAETLFERNYIQKYTIVVEAYDKFGGKLQKELVINKGEAGATPLPSDILLSGFKVEENKPNTNIGTFSLKGDQVNSAHGYAFYLEPGTKDNDIFDLNGADLKTKEGLDFEIKKIYSIRITAKAADGTSLKKDFAIKVTDANDAPENIVLTNKEIFVETVSGTEVGRIAAIDQDPSDIKFTYKFAEGYKDNHHFMILGNALKVKTRFKDVQVLNIGITATDDEDASFTKLFKIKVKSLSGGDINMPPNRIGLTSTVINTSLKDGDKICDIVLSDPDGDSGTFSCDNEYIQIKGDALYLKSRPESDNSFGITIKATDGKNEIEKDFRIYVAKKDNNDDTNDIIIVGKSKIRIYPNPAQSYIHVEGLENAKYQILNVAGVLLKQTQSADLDIGDLAPGCYILRIDTGTEVITKKIIKRNKY